MRYCGGKEVFMYNIGCVAVVSDTVATWICSGNPLKIIFATVFLLGMATSSILMLRAFAAKKSS
jgi:hypothetical protein